MNNLLIRSALGLALLLVFTPLPSIQASKVSEWVLDTQETVKKAAKDTNNEINRSKEKLAEASVPVTIPTGPSASPSATTLVDKQIAVAEIDKLGEQLKNARAEKIEAQDNNKLANAIMVALVGAIGGGVLTMASTGMFGRFDRREKFLAALEREWNLANKGFDFSTVPKYRRLFQPKDRSGEAVK